MTCKATLVTSIGLCLVACGGNTPQRGAGAGEACEIVHSDLTCGAASTSCYSAGVTSSCAGGGRCIGDDNGMRCAYTCKQTSDCTPTSATARCMQDCGVSSLNGFFVEPAVHSRMLSMSCSTAEDHATSTVGVVN